MGCPRRGQWVSTRDTQLNSIPAYHLCSCGYSRSLLRRSSLLYSMYAFVDTLTHCTSSASTQSNASGGGAPCVTAGDTRAKRGGTRGQADYSDPDAGGVALKAWRGVTQTCRSVAAVRHRRCRRFALSSVHGFALRTSPAVKHGMSPPGTVDEHERYSAQFHPCISSMLLRILSFSTSPIATSLWYVCFCGYPHPLHLLRIRIYTEPPPAEAHHA